MFNRFFVLALLLVLILAKRHAPDSPFDTCVKSKCANQLKECAAPCAGKIKECNSKIQGTTPA